MLHGMTLGLEQLGDYDGRDDNPHGDPSNSAYLVRAALPRKALLVFYFAVAHSYRHILSRWRTTI